MFEYQFTRSYKLTSKMPNNIHYELVSYAVYEEVEIPVSGPWNIPSYDIVEGRVIHKQGYLIYPPRQTPLNYSLPDYKDLINSIISLPAKINLDSSGIEDLFQLYDFIAMAQKIDATDENDYLKTIDLIKLSKIHPKLWSRIKTNGVELLSDLNLITHYPSYSTIYNCVFTHRNLSENWAKQNLPCPVLIVKALLNEAQAAYSRHLQERSTAPSVKLTGLVGKLKRKIHGIVLNNEQQKKQGLLTEITTLKAELQAEIDSWWPFYRRALKQEKLEFLTALEALVRENGFDNSGKTTCEKLAEKSLHVVAKGCLSSRTHSIYNEAMNHQNMFFKSRTWLSTHTDQDPTPALSSTASASMLK